MKKRERRERERKRVYRLQIEDTIIFITVGCPSCLGKREELETSFITVGVA